MKLEIYLQDDDKKKFIYQLDSKKEFKDNFREATIAAMEGGVKLADFDAGRVKYRMLKEQDGERCPCCGTPLL